MHLVQSLPNTFATLDSTMRSADATSDSQNKGGAQSFVLQRTRRRWSTHSAGPEKEELPHDRAHKLPASTSRRSSSEFEGAHLTRATSSTPTTTRDQGLSNHCASSKLFKSPSHFASLKSGTSSVLSKHSGASSQSAQGLAGTLHSAHQDKVTRRRHSGEPGGQKLSRGSSSSSPAVVFTSQTQRHGSSVLQSVQSRRRGSLMLTAADSNVAVSSGSAFYASQVMARQASKHKVARAKPRPRSPHSRQSTQSNRDQPAGARVPVSIRQALRLGLFSVFSAFASLLGLLVSVQTYVSLVMAPAKLMAACLSSQPPWSREPEDRQRRFDRERAKGLLESQRRRSSTEDMWAMEALALNYDFSMWTACQMFEEGTQVKFTRYADGVNIHFHISNSILHVTSSQLCCIFVIISIFIAQLLHTFTHTHVWTHKCTHTCSITSLSDCTQDGVARTKHWGHGLVGRGKDNVLDRRQDLWQIQTKIVGKLKQKLMVHAKFEPIELAAKLQDYFVMDY